MTEKRESSYLTVGRRQPAKDSGLLVSFRDISTNSRAAQTHSSTFKHDLLDTMWCTDVKVNAKPILV